MQKIIPSYGMQHGELFLGQDTMRKIIPIGGRIHTWRIIPSGGIKWGRLFLVMGGYNMENYSWQQDTMQKIISRLGHK